MLIGLPPRLLNSTGIIVGNRKAIMKPE